MKQKLAKLVDVKSLVTLALTGLFCTLAWRGTVSAGQFQTIFTTVIAFYFGTQHTKSQRGEGGDEKGH